MKAMAEDWRDMAACIGTTGLFFGADGEPGTAARKREQRAKAVCNACPVLGQCRAYEDAHPTRWGVVARETAEERIKRRSVGKGSKGIKRPGYTRKVA
jgi:WhiB family transcriptional regulator, redox-sensing transcriptional regulator